MRGLNPPLAITLKDDKLLPGKSGVLLLNAVFSISFFGSFLVLPNHTLNLDWKNHTPVVIIQSDLMCILSFCNKIRTIQAYVINDICS